MVTLSNDSTLLHIQFAGQDFQSGGRLVLKVNVDIMQSWSGGSATRVVKGADFDGTSFEAVFSAPHYQTTTVAGFFRNVYDNPVATYGLNLPDDNYDNSSAIFTTNMPPAAPPEPVFTAGTLASMEQTPLPITISGTVYLDNNMNNYQEPGEPGIGGVQLELFSLEGDSYVTTGKTTVTDANGDYQFTGVLPGTYRVVKTEPAGYFNVGDAPARSAVKPAATSPRTTCSATLTWTAATTASKTTSPRRCRAASAEKCTSIPTMTICTSRASRCWPA